MVRWTGNIRSLQKPTKKAGSAHHKMVLMPISAKTSQAWGQSSPQYIYTICNAGQQKKT